MSSTAHAAAAPANDARAAAQALGALPISTKGSVVGATLEIDEPTSCRPSKGSVFYSFKADKAGDLAATLQAAGDLDAVVDIYQRTRSQLTPIACGQTDENGYAQLELTTVAGADYLVRVSSLANSAEDTFTLNLQRPDNPAKAPGTKLAPGGIDGTLNVVINADDAYYTDLHPGTTYRVNLVSPTPNAPVTALLYPPGTDDFADARPVKTLRNTAYTTITPGPDEGGRYVVLVRASRYVRGAQTFHLQVSKAGEDDTAPGINLPNDKPEHGVLQGRQVDTLDVYRFSVARKANLDLTLAGGHNFQLDLFTDRGKRLDTTQDTITRQVTPGRYFAIVRTDDGSAGHYTVKRLTRTITKTTIKADGHANDSTKPGRTVTVGTHISPKVDGPVTLTIERYDPIAGWLFVRRAHVNASNGLATYSYAPPALGRWRVSASFDGTRGASPSASGYARVLVADSLKSEDN